MNTQGPPEHTCAHGRPLFDYEEGLLGEAERIEVEKGLAECPGCRAQLRELRRIKQLIKTSPTSPEPCPEDWRIYEFLHYGADPNGEIEAHVAQCPLCKEAARLMGPASAPEHTPGVLAAKVRAKFRDTTPREIAPGPAAWTTKDDRRAVDNDSSVKDAFWERVRLLFRPRMWAAAAVAVAATLVVVVAWPVKTPQDVAALSPVAWERAPRPKSLQAPDRRAAFIIVAAASNQLLSRRTVDELYGALAPTMDIQERCRIIPPNKVSTLITKMRPRPAHTRDAIKALARGAGLTVAVVIALREEGNRYDATTRLLDAATGTLIAEKHVSGLSQTALPHSLRDTAFEMLTDRFPLQDDAKTDRE